MFEGGESSTRRAIFEDCARQRLAVDHLLARSLETLRTWIIASSRKGPVPR